MDGETGSHADDRARPLPAERTSAWAIASLLCAIGLACPLLSLLAPLLGIKAIAHIRSTPGAKGMGAALGGIIIGTMGTILWIGAAYIWHVEVRTPMLSGPQRELEAGLAGNVQEFKNGFTEPGRSLPDHEAQAFLSELSARYGRLVRIRQDAFRSDPEPGRMSQVIPYVLEFESRLVQAEAKISLFADGISPRWEYLVILDDVDGDVSYPPGAERLPESERESDVEQ